MVDVLTQIEIERPIKEVASFSANPDHATTWYKNIKSAEWKSSPPLAKGSQICFSAQFMGRTLVYTYEITELEEGKRLVMKTAEGPFPMETTYIWEKVSENVTRMSLRNRGNPSGFSKFLSPLMVRMMRKANQKDLKALKAHLEKS